MKGEINNNTIIVGDFNTLGVLLNIYSDPLSLLKEMTKMENNCEDGYYVIKEI